MTLQIWNPGRPFEDKQKRVPRRSRLAYRGKHRSAAQDAEAGEKLSQSSILSTVSALLSSQPPQGPVAVWALLPRLFLNWKPLHGGGEGIDHIFQPWHFLQNPEMFILGRFFLEYPLLWYWWDPGWERSEMYGITEVVNSFLKAPYISSLHNYRH